MMSRPSTPRPVGRVPMTLLLVVAQADGEELLELRSGLIEDPEGPVAGIDQGAGLLDDVAEQDRELDVGLDHEDGVHESPELDRVLDSLVGHRLSVAMAEMPRHWAQDVVAEDRAAGVSGGQALAQWVPWPSACSCSTTMSWCAKASAACSKATMRSKSSARRRPPRRP